MKRQTLLNEFRGKSLVIIVDAIAEERTLEEARLTFCDPRIKKEARMKEECNRNEERKKEIRTRKIKEGRG